MLRKEEMWVSLVKAVAPLLRHSTSYSRCMTLPLEFEDNVQGVNDALNKISVWLTAGSNDGGAYGNVTEDGQQDVDEEVGIATTLKEDT